MIKIIGITSLLTTFAIATATDPIDFSWQWSCGLAATVAAMGSFFDYHTTGDSQRSEPMLYQLSVIGLSVISSVLFFAFFRLIWEDSLQVAVLSGVSGIYGRRALQPLAEKIIGTFS